MIGWRFIKSRTGVSKSVYTAIASYADDLYYEFTDETGRHYRVPLGRLREIQEILRRFLGRVTTVGDCAHGYVKGRSTKTASRVHQGNKHHFVTDIKAFFPTISYDRVRSALCSNGISDSVAKVLAKILTTKNELPQGTTSSPLVSNIVMRDCDDDLYSLCAERSIAYTRYSDDLTFSSAKDFRDATDSLIGTISAHGFEIKQSKTHYKIGPIDMLGVRVRNNMLRPPQEILDKLENAECEALSLGLRQYIEYIRREA